MRVKYVSYDANWLIRRRGRRNVPLDVMRVEATRIREQNGN